MIIKLSLPGQPRPTDLSQFTGNDSGEFAGCEFHANDGIVEADAWFLFEGVDPHDNFCLVPPGQVHFLTAETAHRDDRWTEQSVLKFLQQFSQVHSCHPVDLPNVHFSPPFLPWMVNANHNSIFNSHERDISFFAGLETVEKDRPLSIVSSKKSFTPAHHLRLRFAEKVSQHFKGDVDWFGNGINPLAEKWDGLARYERTIVLENRSDFGIYSEKILDPFLALSQPIYWGAPDISSFLPVSSKLQLNIRDLNGSMKFIEGILSRQMLSSDMENLLVGKSRVISELHFLARIAKIAQTIKAGMSDGNSSRIRVTLQPESTFDSPLDQEAQSVQKSVKNRLKKLFGHN